MKKGLAFALLSCLCFGQVWGGSLGGRRVQSQSKKKRPAGWVLQDGKGHKSVFTGLWEHKHHPSCPKGMVVWGTTPQAIYPASSSKFALICLPSKVGSKPFRAMLIAMSFFENTKAHDKSHGLGAVRYWSGRTQVLVSPKRFDKQGRLLSFAVKGSLQMREMQRSGTLLRQAIQVRAPLRKTTVSGEIELHHKKRWGASSFR
ncbi:MAG: hypothetical protein H6727_10920 [Myxococcales bacterium]|nr:hypothetical protein [Myxococcales bacterium]